jgi:predicted Zn-dependent protease
MPKCPNAQSLLSNSDHLNSRLKAQYKPHRLIALLIGLLLFSTAMAADVKLPVLGDASSGIISKNQEYKLGKTWLQAFRSRVQQYNDPLLQSYLEHLVFDLTTHSELDDTRLTIVVVNNPTINAFAVPGGIIGFHTGIFTYADNEDQLASVIAHELAHLSQRHFARSVEARRNSSTLSLAGLLATLVVSSTMGGDAGLAALSATQALTLEQQLRYSRGNEQEADRLGVKTMIRAERDPNAAAGMLTNMLALTRYNSNRVPEFLLTHPVTERRVADTKARAFKNQQRHYKENQEFYIIKARMQLLLQNNATASIKHFARQLDSNTQYSDAAKYGLALAHLNQNNHPEAKKIIGKLLTDKPNYLPFIYADIEIDIASQQYQQALKKIEQQLTFNQNNYPLQWLQAQVLWHMHKYDKAAQVLTALAKSRPDDPSIWYNLAEVRGLAGNISGVHEARAEYFILVGALDRARKQLGFALKLVSADFKRRSMVEERLADLEVMQKRLESL